MIANTYDLMPRSAITQFPVPSFRPSQPGQVIALDVMPSAGAVCNATEGCAWIDVCDTDILNANSNVAVGCARISAKKDRVEFGSRSFDGASERDVYIIRNNQVVGKFDNNGLTVYGMITSTGGYTTNSALRATK